MTHNMGINSTLELLIGKSKESEFIKYIIETLPTFTGFILVGNVSKVRGRRDTRLYNVKDGCVNANTLLEVDYTPITSECIKALTFTIECIVENKYCKSVKYLYQVNSHNELEVVHNYPDDIVGKTVLATGLIAGTLVGCTFSPLPAMGAAALGAIKTAAASTAIASAWGAGSALATAATGVGATAAAALGTAGVSTVITTGAIGSAVYIAEGAVMAKACAISDDRMAIKKLDSHIAMSEIVFHKDIKKYGKTLEDTCKMELSTLDNGEIKIIHTTVAGNIDSKNKGSLLKTLLSKCGNEYSGIAIYTSLDGNETKEFVLIEDGKIKAAFSSGEITVYDDTMKSAISIAGNGIVGVCGFKNGNQAVIVNKDYNLEVINL